MHTLTQGLRQDQALLALEDTQRQSLSQVKLMPTLQHMGGLLRLKYYIDKENMELDMQVQTHMDWRRPATGSMLKWTQLRRGTTKASLWGLSSIALQNMHARLLKNQRLPVLSVNKLTRGEHDWHDCACALIVYRFLNQVSLISRYEPSLVTLQGGRGLLLQKGS